MSVYLSFVLGLIDSSSVFNRAFTEGNVDVISTFAKVFGGACQIIISVIGFGIIMASIAKNAINGLYAVNPKLFDRVNDIKKAGTDFGKGHMNTNGNGMASNMMKCLGVGLWFVCSIIPNVKAMTDFDGEQPLDAKAYFTKSIPLLCLQVFIGVFIFFGYPSQVTKYISDFGTGCFDVVLTNVDPLAWVQSLPGKMAMINFASDNAPDSYGESVNKIANSMYKAVVGTYNDIEKARRQDVATKIEEIVYEQQHSYFYDKCNDDEYRMSVYSTVTAYQPDTSKMNQTSPDGITTYAFARDVSTILESNMSTKETQGHYVYVQLTFTPKAASNESQAVTCNVTITKTSSGDNGKYIILSGTGKVDDSVNGVEFYANNAQGYMTVNNEDIVVSIDVQSNVANIKVSATKDIGSATNISKITGLYYRDTNGKAHPINAITIGNSGEAVFTPKEATSSYSSWSWGSSPAKKVKETETNTTAPTSSGSVNLN